MPARISFQTMDKLRYQHVGVHDDVWLSKGNILTRWASKKIPVYTSHEILLENSFPVICVSQLSSPGSIVPCFVPKQQGYVMVCLLMAAAFQAATAHRVLSRWSRHSKRLSNLAMEHPRTKWSFRRENYLQINRWIDVDYGGIVIHLTIHLLATSANNY